MTPPNKTLRRMASFDFAEEPRRRWICVFVLPAGRERA